MKNQHIIVPLAVAVVVGGAAFFGGMKYQQSKVAASFGNRLGQFQGGQGRMGRAGMGMNGGVVAGQILTMDDKTLTVKMMDGNTKLVLLSDTVTVSKTDTGSKTDLKTGAQVAIFGT